ncbi:glycosyltransferase family 4 protein [Methanogenium marinum]|uniref:Glycosyltransferase family 4 protein n=1 Tax=Methanogenium marinum TaxID=348610 RepID=A0A9Q4PXP6_9EURY|nr:glycosyltransferase family 4 protein [Methanogenium marinum]MDE4907348.1 glycosyltransferase family 4 protein [Methanogenium marinum]
MKKFALVSAALPPAHSGQSMVLDLFLRDLDPQEYCLITQSNYHKYKLQGNYSSPLLARYYRLQPDFQIMRCLIKSASVLKSEAILKNMLRFRTNQIIKIVQREKCLSIVACTGNLFDLPAVYLASKKLGVPFCIYAFDYYSKCMCPIQQAFAEKYERLMFNEADGIIVPNECMQKEYHKRYGAKSIVIHNPCDLSKYNAGNNEAFSEKQGSEARIVYTGAIYEAHYDAFRNLIKAIELLSIPGLNLHIYTTQSPIKLKANSICGPVINHGHQPVSTMPSLQQSADILFLPLAFLSPYPDVIRTSAPGKIGEYLATGRPILVHAPKDSFVSWYFNKYECGFVVDENDPECLAEGIKKILEDRDLQHRLGRNARIRAEIDFSVEVAKKQFKSLLETI